MDSTIIIILIAFAQADDAAPSSSSKLIKPSPTSNASMAFAVYDFPGTNDGELRVSATEVLVVLEDDGSGWVLCQRKDGTQFVVECRSFV